MPAEPTRDQLLSITPRRAEVLRELADGKTAREIADTLDITVSGVRSHIEFLRNSTYCWSSRELGRWWLQHRCRWVTVMSEVAGIPDR